jgi:hypothetical protein
MKIILKLAPISNLNRMTEICEELKKLPEFDSLELTLSSEYDQI